MNSIDRLHPSKFKANGYCSEITTLADFQALEISWKELYEDCAYPTPFASWEYATEWWQKLGVSFVEGSQNARLLVLTVHAPKGELIGIVPFYYSQAPLPPGALRPLRQLGYRYLSQQEDMTEEPVLLFRRGSECSALEIMLHHLTTRPRIAPWDYFNFRILRPANSTVETDLLTRKYKRILHIDKQADKPGQIARLPATWEEYLQSLSKSMRDNIAYYPRLLERHGRRWGIRWAHLPEEVEAAAQTLVRLHRTRALSQRGKPHFSHIPEECNADFLVSALKRLASSGQAFIATLEVDDKEVASLSLLENAGTVIIYYSGFDPEFHAYSPITLLTAEVIRDSIGRGMQNINFLPGAEIWKTRWGIAPSVVMEEVKILRLRVRSLFPVLYQFFLRRRIRSSGAK